MCFVFVFSWSDVFYLQLNAIVLEDVVFDGIGNVETSLRLDVSGRTALSEGDAVHDIV